MRQTDAGRSALENKNAALNSAARSTASCRDRTHCRSYPCSFSPSPAPVAGAPHRRLARVRQRPRPPVRRVLRPLLRRQHRRRPHPHALDGRVGKRCRLHRRLRRSGHDPRAAQGLGGRQARRPEHRRRERSRCAGRRHASARRRREAGRARALPRASAAAYARTVVLPAEVDQAQSQAKFENGVLTLTLAKKVPAGARS